VHHDRLPGNDSQGIQQSYVIDNLMMVRLLKDYIKKMTTINKKEQRKTKKPDIKIVDMWVSSILTMQLYTSNIISN
jgi:hypothetical protein